MNRHGYDFITSTSDAFNFAKNSCRLHLRYQGTQAEWRIVFFICSALYLFGGVVYLLFASGELQPWASEDTDKSDITKVPVELHENEVQEKLLPEKTKEKEEDAVA